MQVGVLDRARREIAVSGVVQGVGFRPFVFGLASRLGLHGFVKNRQGGVLIEVEGATSALDRFVAALEKGPPLARIDALTWTARPPRGDRAFHIEASEAGGPSPIFVSPDIATCDDCLRELFDPADRRYLYPFLNCTNCGPRLTIIRGAPYDRERTTLAPFPMCRDCRAEFEDPRDRRFHAQPVACPACGPKLRALDAAGAEIGEEPIAWAAARLRAGETGAIKGIGGWHLACDARNEAAVERLRKSKHRDEKPFALMVGGLGAAEELCEISPAERALLASPARPIVLLRKRPEARVAGAVAPRNPLLGVMLPYAPLHHLLLRAVDPAPLVMTSGNLSDEPIAYDDRDALARLGGLAAFFLTHDRGIHSRCDDSVVRVVGEASVHFRRSRGYAPLPVRLPEQVAQPTLALGGELKSTFALADGKNGFLSHHLGDLEYAEAFRAYVASIEHYQALYRIAPRRLVHDLHPDYASTRYALERASREGVELLAVQHHHAHMASCMAENGLRGPAIGVCFDGMGFGADGTAWGGEILLGDCAAVERVAHLSTVRMPGGGQATREPWRMAVSHLRAAGEDPGAIAARVPRQALRAVDQMIERAFNAPLTSSMGRLFDAVAAIALVCDKVSFEGQAAIRLEALAATAAPDGTYPFAFDGPAIDVRPLVVAVARDARRGAPPALIARRFHSSVVELTLQACERVRARSGVGDVALSGGVFLNAILLRETCDGLAARGFRAFQHRLVPPNDGGLSLGQLAVAAARDARAHSTRQPPGLEEAPR